MTTHPSRRLALLRRCLLALAAMPLLQTTGCIDYTGAIRSVVNTAFAEGTAGVLSTALAQVFYALL